jgi:hypothetical protein
MAVNAKSDVSPIFYDDDYRPNEREVRRALALARGYRGSRRRKKTLLDFGITIVNSRASSA